MTIAGAQISKSQRLRAGVLLFASVALVASPLLFSANIANAAGVHIGPENVQSHENPDEDSSTYNYDEWHVGTTGNPDALLEQSFLFGECSVTAMNTAGYSNWPQLLKGYPIGERPTGIDALRDIVMTASLEVESGSATLQFPIFVTYIHPDSGIQERAFGTLRTNPERSGSISFIDNNGAIVSGDAPLGGEGIVDDFLDFLEGLFGAETFLIELLGVGFNASASDETEVTSLTFGGDTYYFGTGNCTDEEPGEEGPGEEGPGDKEPETNLPTRPTPPESVETAVRG